MSESLRQRRVALCAAIALGVLLAVGVGYVLGENHRTSVVWHTGQAYIGDHEASVTTPGWTYGFVSTVPQWIDSTGTTHTDSWPDCVGPSGTSRPVTFATTTVTVTGTTWRQVVSVDCRGR